jgi:NodT family efflux transporter outer membrane factor (OMF) lipoprotein
VSHRLSIATLALLFAGGCTVGPKYQRPAPLPANATAPSAYKETPQLPAGWKLSDPADTQIRGEWWKAFGDATLDSLEARVDISNQNLKAALAQYDAAVQQARAVKSNLYPTITAGPQGSRDRESQHHPLLPANDASSTTYNDFVLSGGTSYEVDAWGQIRREVAQAREQAQASAADLATANLSAHALLAQYYFTLRGYDTQQVLLNKTVADFTNLLQLTLNRFHGGIASEQDVAQARTQLETTRGQAIDVGVARAQIEHAIAVLVGEPASTFSIPPVVLNAPPPVIPPGLPSALLERRPDVAAAERRVAAANEQIGIQKAAYFPVLTFNGNGGFESTALQTLIQGPSSLWSVGGTAIETLFDGGKRKALSAEARDQYDQQVALYRQTSLTAFQQVEDNLAALRVLQDEAAAYNEAEAAAQRSAALSVNRYKGGITTYLEVLNAEAALLNAERTSADVLTRRFTSSVLLIQALGGGWDVSKLLKG